MIARNVWVMLPKNPIKLANWRDLDKYDTGIYLYDPSDIECPWGRITPGVSRYIWNTVQTERVPSRIRALALLLS